MAPRNTCGRLLLQVFFYVIKMLFNKEDGITTLCSGHDATLVILIGRIQTASQQLDIGTLQLTTEIVLALVGRINLQGVEIQKPVKGVYIQNGRKVVIK